MHRLCSTHLRGAAPPLAREWCALGDPKGRTLCDSATNHCSIQVLAVILWSFPLTALLPLRLRTDLHCLLGLREVRSRA